MVGTSGENTVSNIGRENTNLFVFNEKTTLLETEKISQACIK